MYLCEAQYSQDTARHSGNRVTSGTTRVEGIGRLLDGDRGVQTGFVQVEFAFQLAEDFVVDAAFVP